MATNPKIVPIGRILPWTLALLFVANYLLQFAPGYWFMNALVPQRSRISVLSTAPFRSNYHGFNPTAFGDLAALSNCQVCRQYRKIMFDTDSMGYHNPGYVGQVPDGILLGDSFGEGEHQPNGHTLAEQISKRTGKFIYNGSNSYCLSFPELIKLTEQLGIDHGVIIWEMLDRHLPEPPNPLTSRFTFSRFTELKYRLHGIENLLEYQPLALWARHLIDYLEANGVFPNQASSLAEDYRSSAGKHILFYPHDSDSATKGTLKVWENYFLELNRRLEARHFELMVVVVPTKTTTYQNSIPGLPLTQDALWDEDFTLALRRSGISAVNFTPWMQRVAKEDLENGKLIYWRDDSHWNSDGVKAGVDSACNAWRAGNSPLRCQDPSSE